MDTGCDFRVLSTESALIVDTCPEFQRLSTKSAVSVDTGCDFRILSTESVLIVDTRPEFHRLSTKSAVSVDWRRYTSPTKSKVATLMWTEEGREECNASEQASRVAPEVLLLYYVVLCGWDSTI